MTVIIIFNIIKHKSQKINILVTAYRYFSNYDLINISIYFNYFKLSVYIPYIFKCAQSPVMKTRMLAATSIAPQVMQNKLVEHLNITCYELTIKHLNENTTHGLLLQVVYFVFFYVNSIK